MLGDNQNKPEKNSVTQKKTLIYILIAVVILFPTILAIANVLYSQTNDVDADTEAVEVILYNSSGAEVYRENEDERADKEESLINIFNALYASLEPVDSIPDEVLAAGHVRAEMIFKTATRIFDCYFIPESGLSYCKNDAGASFKIDFVEADRFLRSVYSEPVYAASAPPVLKSFTGDIILPSALSWNYRNVHGELVAAQKSPTQPADIVYEMSGGLAFEFEVPPDTASVKVFENGVKVFDDKISKLESLTLKSDTLADVSISATWKKTDGCTYYGDVSYSFSVSIQNRAEFYFDAESLGQGEFAILTAKNIYNPARIKFTSNVSGFTPRSVSQGDILYMIISRNQLPERLEKFEFSVAYGVSNSSFTVSLPKALSGVTQKQLYDSVNILDINASISDDNILQSLFLYGKKELPSDSFIKTNTFGGTVSFEGNDIVCPFEEYTACQSDEYVKAVSGGRVAYVGVSTEMGNCVVVDMGLGLRVWYCNLSVVDVSEGEYIAAGQVLGKCGMLLNGSTSHHDAHEGFALMLTCNGAPMNTQKMLLSQ